VSWLRRVLPPSGQLPDELRAELAAGKLLMLEEGLRGSVTYRNYRAPGEYTKWSKSSAQGAIAVTSGRLVVWAGRFKHIDTPHQHPVRRGIGIFAERPFRICFRYNLGATNTAMSGTAEVRLRTDRAAEIADLLRRLAESD
jgi:hypothetical protein